MEPKAVIIQNMLLGLDDSDYNIIMDYIQMLAATKKKGVALRSIAAMRSFQNEVKDSIPWESEDEMLLEMADFRRKRMGLE